MAIEKSEQVVLVLSDGVLAHPAKMSDQPAPLAADECKMLVAISLERQVAFGVRSHRPVVDVGRADPQESVVDDHDLAVNHHRHRRPLILHGGIENAQPVGDAGRDERVHEAAATAPHRLRFQPRRMRLRRHDEHA